MSDKRLTWVPGDRPEGDLDETSRKILAAQPQSGTSIFDPVLCELVYRWFCPPGGQVLDPFAGGSVRGIVAAKLGRNYTGVDLSGRQIEANRQQAEAICTSDDDESPRRVVVSAKWAAHQFPCLPAYITGNCRGRCCEGTGRILVSLLPTEEAIHEVAGNAVESGLLQPDPQTGKCPYKRADGLCGVHGTEQKPFGCVASPFTLNASDTLIVRHRYSRLACHGQGEPAFVTFRASLDLIFGDEEAARVCAQLAAGQGDVVAGMPAQSYRAIKYLDGVKHGVSGAAILPTWIIGDSRNIATLAPGGYDLIFSCPPYADLEVYSDDPADISTMGYEDFLVAYRQIIARSVAMLKGDRFACFVVGDIRDRRGMYRNFVGDTVAAFRDAGMELYNDAVLVTAVGSLPIRVGKQFEAGRKLGKTHQNVLVFVKGDPRKATEAIGRVECGSITPADPAVV